MPLSCLIAPSGSAFAAGHYRFSLPSGPKNPSGLRIQFTDRGIDANGYRPIDIEVATNPLKPLVADRQIRVVLEFRRMGSQSYGEVSQVIDLPEGSTRTKATLLVPQSGGFNMFSLRTYEGGEKLRDISQNYLGWPNSLGWSWTEARPSLLFIDSHVPPPNDRSLAIQNLQTTGADPSPTYTLPDVRPLLAHFPDLNNQPRSGPGAVSTAKNFTAPQISDTAMLSLIFPRSRTEMIGPAELPSRWIELSQYDVAVISLADLKMLAESDKARFASLRDWLSTGPLLITYGAGSDFSKLGEIEKLLELPSLSHAVQSPKLLGWTSPHSKQNTGALLSPFDEYMDATPVDETGGQPMPRPEESKTTVEPNAGEPPPFVFRSAGLGCVVAIASESPFPGQQKDWAWIFNAAGESHWKWFRRTGMSQQRTNDDYWKFLIPGVGKAPILPFLFLVSLFAIVIGPINFFLLRRIRRLYLLLLTVPVGAALVTVGLIAFALLSDGLGIRLRVRSFADFDQQTGRVAVWSRQSYYAALAPSQGLVFPVDTVAYPLAHEPGASANDRATLLVWDGDQQLRRGYLSARTATQYIVCRATTSDARLVINETSTPVGQASQPALESLAPRVQNRLGATVKYLLVHTTSGAYFDGRQIADGDLKVLSATDTAAAITTMRPLADAVEPKIPDHDPTEYGDNIFTLLRANRSRLPTSDSGAGDPLLEKSLLEANITATIRELKPPLPPRSYIAIVEHSPFVVSGVPNSREEASLHVIRGRY